MNEQDARMLLADLEDRAEKAADKWLETAQDYGVDKTNPRHQLILEMTKRSFVNGWLAAYREALEKLSTGVVESDYPDELQYF